MSNTIEHGVQLTDQAKSKVKALISAENPVDENGNPLELRLRIAVEPGGCSGLRYQLFFDERVEDGDSIIDFDGVEVIVDRMSIPMLDGATIDFEDTIQKSGFTIDNPNAQGTCACGDSFN
jgi:iron-sulfur cluster assembly accessory protein